MYTFHPQGNALDLTEKRVKTERGPVQRSPAGRSPSPQASPCPGLEDWSVEQVVTWVMGIDVCREYGQVRGQETVDRSPKTVDSIFLVLCTV